MTTTTATLERTLQPRISSDDEADDEAAFSEAIRSGDRDAFTQLFVEERAFLTNVLRPCCRNESDVQDIIQESFRRLWKHRLRIKAESRKSLRAFLKRVAMRAWIDCTRRRDTRTALAICLRAIEQAFVRRREQDILTWLDLKRILKFLDANPNQLEAVLACLEGETQEEAGDTFDLSRDQVKRLVEKLRVLYIRKGARP